jgi:hypothetical protein
MWKQYAMGYAMGFRHTISYHMKSLVPCGEIHLCILLLPACVSRSQLPTYASPIAIEVMAGGLHPPLEVISSWHFNYTNPGTSGYYIVVLVGVMLALGYVAVTLRLVSRLYFQRTFGVDDALIVFNMVGHCCRLFHGLRATQLRHTLTLHSFR